jgi:hypothetical protein
MLHIFLIILGIIFVLAALYATAVVFYKYRELKEQVFYDGFSLDVKQTKIEALEAALRAQKDLTREKTEELASVSHELDSTHKYLEIILTKELHGDEESWMKGTFFEIEGLETTLGFTHEPKTDYGRLMKYCLEDAEQTNQAFCHNYQENPS